MDNSNVYLVVNSNLKNEDHLARLMSLCKNACKIQTLCKRTIPKRLSEEISL